MDVRFRGAVCIRRLRGNRVRDFLWFNCEKTLEKTMTYVVTEPCFGCKYTDCVTVCPCDSFREGQEILYIDPDSCIDCDACLPECPVEAIFRDDNVPEQWTDYIALNAEMAATCPPIVEQKDALQNERCKG